MYPDYKIDIKHHLDQLRKKHSRKSDVNASNVNMKRLKQETLERLKTDIAAGVATSTERFYINAPTKDAHQNHDLGSYVDASLMPLNKDLISKIHDLVLQGTDRLKDVRHILRDHVLQMFNENDWHPNLADRGYFPNDTTIVNHINSAKRKKRKTLGSADVVEEECDEDFDSLPTGVKVNVKAERAECLTALTNATTAVFLCRDKDILMRAKEMADEITKLLKPIVSKPSTSSLIPAAGSPKKIGAAKRKRKRPQPMSSSRPDGPEMKLPQYSSGIYQPSGDTSSNPEAYHPSTGVPTPAPTPLKNFKHPHHHQFPSHQAEASSFTQWSSGYSLAGTVYNQTQQQPPWNIVSGVPASHQNIPSEQLHETSLNIPNLSAVTSSPMGSHSIPPSLHSVPPHPPANSIPPSMTHHPSIPMSQHNAAWFKQQQEVHQSTEWLSDENISAAHILEGLSRL